MKSLNDVSQTIGHTPMVELNRFAPRKKGRLFAKLEFFSPGQSKKDRVAKQIIEDAEKDGILKPGQTVVELTSGNTGTGLAIVCAVKGYPFVAVISKSPLADKQFNLSHHLQVSPYHPDYWFYRDESDHRFNQVLDWPNGTLELVREVESVSFRGDRAEYWAKKITGSKKTNQLLLPSFKVLSMVFSETVLGDSFDQEEKKTSLAYFGIFKTT